MDGEATRALGELGAAGWPFGLMLAVVLAGDRLREVRRRATLNRALHELRRPLQALVLSRRPGPRGDFEAADLALAALDDLDREINGSPLPAVARPVACRALVESALERWRSPAAAARRSLELRWRAGSATVVADPRRVAQALDNLIANAVEHGGVRVLIDATVCARGARIAVWNSTREPVAGEPARRDRRRRNGLRIVSSIAAEHGGRFVTHRSARAWTAVLELPLAPMPLSKAAQSGLAGASDEVAVPTCLYPSAIAPGPAENVARRARLSAE